MPDLNTVGLVRAQRLNSTRGVHTLNLFWSQRGKAIHDQGRRKVNVGRCGTRQGKAGGWLSGLIVLTCDFVL